jgi:hypothetical protein
MSQKALRRGRFASQFLQTMREALVLSASLIGMLQEDPMNLIAASFARKAAQLRFEALFRGDSIAEIDSLIRRERRRRLGNVVVHGALERIHRALAQQERGLLIILPLFVL